MQVIRVIVWVILAIAMTAFIAMNWGTAPVRFWPLGDGDFLRFDWPIGFTALFFFLLGLLPTWLLSKAGRWRLTRRINSLENTIKAAVTGNPHAVGTSTQLDAGPTDTQAN